MDVTVTQAISWTTALKDKYLIILQDPSRMHPNAANFAFVLASTDNDPERKPERFLAKLDTDDGFRGPTVVDGRWVYTLPRPELLNAHYQFTLSTERMDDITDAVFSGLQLETSGS